jgi:hypothetical protein
MKRIDGNRAKMFQDIADMGISFFQYIYIEPNRANIAKTLKIQHFLKFVTEEGNQVLMEYIYEELKVVLTSFKKDKSPRLCNFDIPG